MPNAPYHHQNPHLRRQQERSAAAERQAELTAECPVIGGKKCTWWVTDKNTGGMVCRWAQWRHQPCRESEMQGCPRQAQIPLVKPCN